LYWEPLAETFVIERPQIRSPDHNVNHAPEIAPHTLFTVCTQSSDQLGKVLDTSSNEIEESLRIHAFYDVSVLEVFVNDRTAVSTRIYVDNPRCFGIRFFADGPESGLGRRNSAESLMNDTAIAVVQRATVWDGLEA
jgi:beta-fructofuranosidase